MKYNIEKLKEIARRKPETEIIYFWGHTPDLKKGKMTRAYFSQWYDCYFEVEGVMFHTAEQYMMACKALLFGDDEGYQEIMTADNPKDYKQLGRRIRGFEQALWDSRKYDIVVEGNKAKFGQNPDIREFLLSTADAIIAEASPYDNIWGIGLDRETAMKGSVAQWKGENLLGCALMEVRDWLNNKEE